jgi:hypothetical protein
MAGVSAPVCLLPWVRADKHVHGFRLALTRVCQRVTLCGKLRVRRIGRQLSLTQARARLDVGNNGIKAKPFASMRVRALACKQAA